jgi:hypothetical protein
MTKCQNFISRILSASCSFLGKRFFPRIRSASLAHKGVGACWDLSIMAILVSLLRGNVLMCYSVLNVLHTKHEHPEDFDIFM